MASLKIPSFDLYCQNFDLNEKINENSTWCDNFLNYITEQMEITHVNRGIYVLDYDFINNNFVNILTTINIKISKEFIYLILINLDDSTYEWILNIL